MDQVVKDDRRGKSEGVQPDIDAGGLVGLVLRRHIDVDLASGAREDLRRIEVKAEDLAAGHARLPLGVGPWAVVLVAGRPRVVGAEHKGQGAEKNDNPV